MEDMPGMWENFHLNDREEVPFEFGPEEEIEKFYLAARFMTSRVLNIESVVRTFKPLWRAVHGFTARDMGNNMLGFVFEDVSDLERVLQSEPWLYDKHLVSFQRVEADTTISEMDCQWASFWVQIHNLPVRRMNHETASALGGTLGVVEKVVESEEERGREGCMRVRVKVDISKPLCRGRKARLLAGKETWIAFKYERLPNFCYWCGLLTHGDRECEKWLRSKGSLRREDQQYGAWLRASVERPIRRVEVKVIGRSEVHRWGKSYQSSEQHGDQNSIHGGSGSSKAAKPFMDFTQLKENLPNPDTAVNEDQSLPTKSAAPIPCSDPITAVDEEQSLPKSSATPIPTSDPSPAANHVESSLHSCAKSLPDSLQHDVSKRVDKTNHNDILQDISGSLGKGKARVKRNEASSDGDSNHSAWQKKLRGNEGIKTTTLVGDEAEAVFLAWEEVGGWLFCGMILLKLQSRISHRIILILMFSWWMELDGGSQDFYGHPEGHRKWESWVLMDKLHSLDNIPWLCMGDFNEILSLSERSGEFLGSTRRMQDFYAVVNRPCTPSPPYGYQYQTLSTKKEDLVNLKRNAEEVRMTLFQMHPSKAPGPDGMSSFFFQKYWNIVGANVSAAVLSVLNSGKMLRKINLTHISLIPKKKNPERMSEYRPISLCNVVYKIISKMKAKRKGKKGEMAIKLDMSKAYDRVEWAFVEVQYSVLIDGVPKGYINPTRGIRQGDPLSPYVFLLCAEGLSALFQQSSAMGHLKGTQLCRGGPWVSLLMIGRSKKSIFNGLKERIVHRLQGWKERFLSKAGREVLIKACRPSYPYICYELFSASQKHGVKK
uniref:Reverse transcriptase domain-containing protein n=1 Tax=Fagus sylvatica TaxID=28930 RepID=A0A2N9GDF4_FAGSY